MQLMPVKFSNSTSTYFPTSTDSCQVNNGGCDPNAVCSHEETTNAVKCTCKTGYTNVGTGSTVVCKGNTFAFESFESYTFWKIILDSCEVNNGGCDPNAVCSHDSATNAVRCTCKTGYTNTATNSTVVCTGNIQHTLFCTYNLESFIHASFQIVVWSTMVDVIDVLHALMIQKPMKWFAHARRVIQIQARVQT